MMWPPRAAVLLVTPRAILFVPFLDKSRTCTEDRSSRFLFAFRGYVFDKAAVLLYVVVLGDVRELRALNVVLRGFRRRGRYLKDVNVALVAVKDLARVHRLDA